ncbi:hypothetical protein L208DRAFT_1504223 [Tricholoma matsutake]|nr:hypothetical protein L208DRAFT_1504223 [Tricholoma matsutake 945]
MGAVFIAGLLGLPANLQVWRSLLHLHPYNANEQYQGKLQPISNKSIQPALVICPNAMECQTLACKSCSLHQFTPIQDIPHVTLIKDATIHDNVPILTGLCNVCNTKYKADYKRGVENEGGNRFSRLYLNSAKYLKVGWGLWVDQSFSQAVLNGLYSFHASAGGYTKYWNNSFWKQLVQFKKVTQCHVWQAFVQESMCSIASASDIDLILQDGLSIDEVTKEALRFWEQMELSELLESIHVLNAHKYTRQPQMSYPAQTLQQRAAQLVVMTKWRLTTHLFN